MNAQFRSDYLYQFETLDGYNLLDLTYVKYVSETDDYIFDAGGRNRAEQIRIPIKRTNTAITSRIRRLHRIGYAEPSGSTLGTTKTLIKHSDDLVVGTIYIFSKCTNLISTEAMRLESVDVSDIGLHVAHFRALGGNLHQTCPFDWINNGNLTCESVE